MELSDKLKGLLGDFLQALSTLNVEFLVVGGVAVNHHGYSRSSNDIDLWYYPVITNFEKILKALEKAGHDTTDLKQLVFDPKKTYLRIPLGYFQIELLPGIHEGMTPAQSKKEFKACMAKCDTNQVGKTKFPVIGYDDLIRFKKISARPKDLLDVNELERLRKSTK